MSLASYLNHAQSWPGAGATIICELGVPVSPKFWDPPPRASTVQEKYIQILVWVCKIFAEIFDRSSGSSCLSAKKLFFQKQAYYEVSNQVMLTRTWASRPRPRTRDIKVKFCTGLHHTSFFIVNVVWVFLCSRTTFCQFMNKWICYCCYDIDKEECQTVNIQKDDTGV